jgi:hypothetical protein
MMLLWGTSTALPDTTVLGDQNLVSNAPKALQTGANVPVMQGDAGAGYVLSSPKVGTITSWSFLSGGVATGKQFELAVLAPTDQSGQGWRLLSTSPPVAVRTATGTDAVNGPFPVDLPIDVGERIALMPLDDSIVPIENGTQNADGIRYFPHPFAGGLGSSQQIAPGSSADGGQIVPVQATVLFSGPPVTPQNTQLPSITGTPSQFETLDGDAGLWQNGVTGFRYGWLRCTPAGTNCATIPGALSRSYALTRSDVGFTIRLRVIASNEGGDSPPALSAPTAVVQGVGMVAKLRVYPNPSCAGIPTTLDASGSASPDGIKSYSFSIIDFYAADLATRKRLGTGLPPAEANVEADMTWIAADLTLPSGVTDPLDGNTASDLEKSAGPPIVGDKASIVHTFDWNRAAISTIGVLVRDPVGVLLVVTDFAGHTAQAVAVLHFAQTLSSDSRAGCPKPRQPLKFIAPNAVLATQLAFPTSGSGPTTTTSCSSRVTCVGTITVALRSARAIAADRGQSVVLASAFFNIPPGRKLKVVLELTKLGKSRLRVGARVPVRVTVESTSPTGRTVKHVYLRVLTR